ncbi:prolyl-tRNA synthetase associated domain-containing protein [Roseiterribacter gracilis]|uniref:DNA-binding protein n=1 Tax=Roseiterribacter gracilis TaxID=2812848 RepID=A0A8S8XA83_9PROT|nr:DNA-binding protein [Rhodospirillales bacterium TMPK1]
MTPAEQALRASLDAADVAFTTIEHEPVFTVEQSAPLHDKIPGLHTKNLFLKDADGALFLVTAPALLPLDLKRVASLIGAKRLSFGRPDLLIETLGVEPGSVTTLAAFNDRDGRVRVVLDRTLAGDDDVGVHPLRNSATTILRGTELVRWLTLVCHAPLIVDLEQARRN